MLKSNITVRIVRLLVVLLGLLALLELIERPSYVGLLGHSAVVFSVF